MKKDWRYKIYKIVEIEDGSKLGLAYNIFMILCIVGSLVPLVFKEEIEELVGLDKITVIFFIIDYVLRWLTADYKLGRRHIVSWLRYPLTPMAIIDLVSILPSFSIVNEGFKAMRILRVLRSLKILRLLRLARYSTGLQSIKAALTRSKDKLIIVAFIAVLYVLATALLVFNLEPDTFDTFFDALYWATVSLTTVGYGDIYPVTTVGRAISMISTLCGVAVIALPASIITADFMAVIEEEKSEKQ